MYSFAVNIISPLGKMEPWIACNMHRQSKSSVNVGIVIRFLTLESILCVTKVTVVYFFHNHQNATSW